MFIIYLFRQFIFRIKEFLRHWYVGSFFVFSHFAISALEKMDRGLAWKITFRHFFEPLYQDYSFMGYILGFFFRFMRLLIGAAIYAPVILATVFLYLAWAALPLFAIYKIFH